MTLRTHSSWPTYARRKRCCQMAWLSPVRIPTTTQEARKPGKKKTFRGYIDPAQQIEYRGLTLSGGRSTGASVSQRGNVGFNLVDVTLCLIQARRPCALGDTPEHENKQSSSVNYYYIWSFTPPIALFLVLVNHYEEFCDYLGSSLL